MRPVSTKQEALKAASQALERARICDEWANTARRKKDREALVALGLENRDQHREYMELASRLPEDPNP